MATAEVRDEFKRLLISKNTEPRSDTGNTESWSSIQITPEESIIDAEGITADDGFEDRCADRWEAALNRCKAGLAPEDFKLVQQFDSPEKLISGLEEMRRPPDHIVRDGFQNLMYQVHDMEHSVRPVLSIFILTMLPRSVTTGLVWGIMYLVIRLSAEQEATARQLAGMFLKIRRQMAILKKRAARIEKSARGNQDKSELRIIFVDIFEALIFFWRNCVVYLRKFPPGRFKLQNTKEWADIETSFAETLLKIEDAMDHLRVYVAIDVAAAPAAHLHNLPTTKSWDDESRVFPLHLLPDSRTSLFLGRDDVLSDIDSYFHISSQLKDELAVYVICGVGGMGKTEIAREYAHRNKGTTDAILWVGSESQESLRTAFTRIAIELCLPGADFKADPAHNLALVHHWFRVTTHNWLLILDNVEKYSDVEKYLPTESRGSVIVTTRYITQAKLFHRRHKILEKLTSATAENLFLRLIAAPESKEERLSIDQLPETERNAVRFLLTEMDGLALGIHQMAALIESQSLQDDIAKFAGRYKRYLPVILQKQEGIKGHTLSTLWKISFETVRTRPSAFVLLGILSLVQPDEIPKELFLPTDTSTLTSDLAFCTDDFELDETVSFLKALGLIDTDGHRLSLHRLVQVAFMMQLSSEERQRVVDGAALLLRLAFPAKSHGHLYTRWAGCQKYIQHGTALAWWFEKFTTAGQRVASPPAFVSCTVDCAWYLIESGNARDAHSVLEIAIDANGSKLDMDESHLLNALGMAYFDLNQLAKCHMTLNKSHRIRESLLDPNDLYLAASFQNLGNIESAEGNFETAIHHFEKTLSIRKAHDGDFSATAAGSGDELSPGEKSHLMVTAVTYLSKGRAHLGAKDYAATIASLKLSQSFWERAGSQDALEYIANYMYGNLYLATEDYDAAVAIYQKALDQIHINAPGQPLEVSIYYKLGTAEFCRGDLEGAMVSLSRGLQKARLREDCLGHQARLLRREAQVVKCAHEKEDGSTGLDSIKPLDPEELMSSADKIRLKLQGTGYRICETEEEEEKCFENLVGPFQR
ncbi:hypothetical protein F4803DRAFT_524980 [Xylaria telfairii]|nr:hypothetical protein F4803DRAFT_524980 [Xylaria telfairii]